MDWFSRFVPSWALSVTMEAPFCIEALEKALRWVGGPQAGLRGSRQLKGRKAALVLVAVEKRGRGEACHDSEYREKATEQPGRCIGRQHAETDHQVNRRDPVRSGGEDSDRTDEARDNRAEGRAATFIKPTETGKGSRTAPARVGSIPAEASGAQSARTVFSGPQTATCAIPEWPSQQPRRRFTLLYDKVCWQDILREVEQELRSREYRCGLVRRVHIPKPGQPGRTRPLGIPTAARRKAG